MSDLGSILRLEYGAALSAENRTGWGYPVFGSNGEVGRHERFLIGESGIVVGRKGSVGQVSWSDEPFWPIDTAYWVDCREQDRRWLYWLLSHLPLKRLDTSTGVPGLNRNDVYELDVYRPEPAARDKITEILDTLDATIRGTEAVVAKLKGMKQGLLHDLLTRGIDVNGDLRPPQPEAPHLYRQTPLGWLPKEWDALRIAEIGDVRTGKTPPAEDPMAWGEHTPFVTPGDVTHGFAIEQCERKLSVRGRKYVPNVPAGATLVVCIGSTIGKVGYVCEESSFNQQINAVVPNPGYDSGFVFQSICKSIYQLHRLAGLQAVPIVNKGEFRKIRIPVAPKEEQIEIIAHLSQLEEREGAEITKLQKLRATKSGLMDDLLTGGKPVTALL